MHPSPFLISLWFALYNLGSISEIYILYISSNDSQSDCLLTQGKLECTAEKYFEHVLYISLIKSIISVILFSLASVSLFQSIFSLSVTTFIYLFFRHSSFSSHSCSPANLPSSSPSSSSSSLWYRILPLSSASHISSFTTLLPYPYHINLIPLPINFYFFPYLRSPIKIFSRLPYKKILTSQSSLRLNQIRRNFPSTLRNFPPLP